MNSIHDVHASIRKLHRHLEHAHWDGGALVGPDIGLRWDFRLLRFARSYLGLPSMPRHLFLQTQGYWIRANWRLFEASGDPRYAAMAQACTRRVIALQEAEGGWPYPLPERAGLRATVEGCFAAVGLVETFRMTSDPKARDAADRWYRFLVGTIGFQKWKGTLAINYFDRPRGNIPNNTVDALWMMAEMADATGRDRYLEHARGMLDFLEEAQLATGELPYSVSSPFEPSKTHYLCFQYNAFQLVKLLRFHELTGSGAAMRIAKPLASWLGGGISKGGHCKADCRREAPEVPYWTAILAEALLAADRYGLGERRGEALSLFAKVLEEQQPDGGWDFSRREPGGLVDRGRYPRNEVMILDSLMQLARATSRLPRRTERRPGRDALALTN